jgi:two-component system NtrC family sensor kinase
MTSNEHLGNGASSSVAARLESLTCMACGITHDLNNYLAAILSNIEVALKGTPEDSGQYRYLTRVASNTNKAISLIQRLQSLTENGNAFSSTVSLTHLVQQAVADLKKSVGLTDNINIDTDGIDPSARVATIPDLLEESIYAIMKNGIEACGNSSGTIHVRTLSNVDYSSLSGDIVLGNISSSSCDVLEIEDNGEGIPPELEERIFDPFFSTRLRAHGLGLTPLVGLVHSSKATVHIRSTVGEGTTFSICFPAKKDQP